jgi:hypothetical protein
MFKITEFTEALLESLSSKPDKDGKPGVSLGIAMQVDNEVLDSIDPTLAPQLFKHNSTQPLPGVRDALTVVACNSVERTLLTTKHEGWTLKVDDGIDESKPLTFGSCKLNKFSVEAHQGGKVTLRYNAWTTDIDAARFGMLGMHVDQAIWIMATPPKPGEEPKSTPPKKDPDATDLFAGRDPNDDDDQADDEGDSEGGETDAKAAPAKTTKSTIKYRDPMTGSTWSGRGLQPKWLKVALEGGRKLSEFDIAAKPAQSKAKLSSEPAWPFPSGKRPDSGAPPAHITEPKISKAARKRGEAGAA